jgi:hypothetical protein
MWEPQPLETLWVYSGLYRDSVLGTSATLQKATVSFIASVHLFSWNNSAPTGQIFMKFDNFLKLHQENSSFIKVRQE